MAQLRYTNNSSLIPATSFRTAAQDRHPSNSVHPRYIPVPYIRLCPAEVTQAQEQFNAAATPIVRDQSRGLANAVLHPKWIEAQHELHRLGDPRAQDQRSVVYVHQVGVLQPILRVSFVLLLPNGVLPNTITRVRASAQPTLM